MDSIVNYGSEEDEPDVGHKSRDSSSSATQANRHDMSNNKKNVKDRNLKKDRNSAERRYREANHTKRDIKDRDRDQTRPRSSKREDRPRSYERRRDDRERDDRRRDRHRDRGEFRNRNDQKHWYRTSSKDRHRDSSSPSDKRDKERRRHRSRSNSQDKKSLNKSTSSTDNTSGAIKYREQERLTNDNDPHHLNPIVSKEPYTPPATVTENRSETPAALPSYYNPNIINPNKYAEQVQKRKLLWGNKKSEETASKWGSAKFAQDTDGKVAHKFMRLMGIKDVPKVEEIAETTTGNCSESIKKREEMFSSMEQQYEVARQATHTMRGVGLGFNSQGRPF